MSKSKEELNKLKEEIASDLLMKTKDLFMHTFWNMLGK